MKLRSKILPFLCCPLFLAGCGEGYELVRVDNVFPYGTRTAGSGYAYVLKSMLPPKELKVEAVNEVKRDWEPELPKTEPAKEIAVVPVVAPKPVEEPLMKADDIFLDDGKK